MPLSESSYLPPAAFILSHVLGIAGVLYWRSRSGAGRGEALKWLAWGRVGARCGKDGRTDRRGAGRREEAPGRAGLAVPKLGLSPPGGSAEGGLPGPGEGGRISVRGLAGDEAVFCLGASPAHVVLVVVPGQPLPAPTSPRPLAATAAARRNPQKPTKTHRNPQKPAVAARAVAKTPPRAARALAAAPGAAGVTLPQFPKIGPVCDRITRAARVRYGAGRNCRAGQGATSAFSLLTSPSWDPFVCLHPPGQGRVPPSFSFFHGAG